MKLTVSLLLLAAISQAAEVPSRSRKKTEDSKTEKRALVEGNAGVEKRAPIIATAVPSVTPGIEYADVKDLESEKSPQQQIYAPQVPQLAKISDVLTGQAPSYQAAIASHLFSPVSVYQTRLAGYEVSAPVASQLAYTEKITYQPQANAFNTQVLKKQPQRIPYQPIQYQQVPQIQQIPQIQQVQQLPQPIPINQYQPIQQAQLIQIQPYQNPLVYNQQQIQQIPFQFTPQSFARQPFPFAQHQLPNTQPGVVYAREEESQRPIQRELKNIQAAQVTPAPVEQKQNQNQQQTTQHQGATSYASFSVGAPVNIPQQHQASNQQFQAQHYQQQRSQQQVQQHQAQLQKSQEIQQTQQYQAQQAQQYQIQQQQVQYQPQRPEIQYPQQQPFQHQQPLQIFHQQPQQVQFLNYQQPAQQNQPQNLNHQYQIQRQPLPLNRQYQLQSQPQEIQPQVLQKLEPSPSNSVNVQSKPLPSSKPVAYYRPEPVAYQPQVYSGQGLVFQNQVTGPEIAVPTFPPVQYFGKFAHELFRSYQPQ